MEILEYEQEIMESLSQIIPADTVVTRDSDLLQLGIDSINFVRLIVMLEEKFEIEIDDDDVLLTNFSSVGQINEILKKTMGR